MLVITEDLMTELNKSQQSKDLDNDDYLDGEETFATEAETSTWDISQRSRASQLGTSTGSDRTSASGASAALKSPHASAHRRRRGTFTMQRQRSARKNRDTQIPTLNDVSLHELEEMSASLHRQDDMGGSSCRTLSRRASYRQHRSTAPSKEDDLQALQQQEDNTSHTMGSSSRRRVTRGATMGGSLRRQGSIIRDDSNMGSSSRRTVSMGSSYRRQGSRTNTEPSFREETAMGSSSRRGASSGSRRSSLHRRTSQSRLATSNHSCNQEDESETPSFHGDEEELDLPDLYQDPLGSSSFHSASCRRCSFQPLNSSLNFDVEETQEGELAHLDLSTRGGSRKTARRRVSMIPEEQQQGSNSPQRGRLTKQKSMSALLQKELNSLTCFVDIAQFQVQELADDLAKRVPPQQEEGWAGFVQARVGTFKKNMDTIGSALVKSKK